MPFGLAAAVLFTCFLHEHEHTKRVRKSIDILGAILFTVAVAAILMALTEAGTSNNVSGLMAAALFFLSLVLFVAQERRADDPMISLALWSRRPIAAANGVDPGSKRTRPMSVPIKRSM